MPVHVTALQSHIKMVFCPPHAKSFTAVLVISDQGLARRSALQKVHLTRAIMSWFLVIFRIILNTKTQIMHVVNIYIYVCLCVCVKVSNCAKKKKSYVFMANGLIAYVHVYIFGKRFGGFFSFPCMY